MTHLIYFFTLDHLQVGGCGRVIQDTAACPEEGSVAGACSIPGKRERADVAPTPGLSSRARKGLGSKSDMQ